MGDFRAVVIERGGGHYRLTRDGQVLLAMPLDLFERFEADTVFPPGWRDSAGHHPVRRLYWNPATAEFLMGGLEEHPARLAESFGSAPFRSYLKAFWIPEPPTLLLRPFWNPSDPYAAFDQDARRQSFRAQWHLREILAGLRPPQDWSVVFNTVDEYLETLGVSVEGPSDGRPGEILETHLAPAAPLSSPLTVGTLEALVVGEAGENFPVLRGDTLTGVHALGLAELRAAEALLTARGFACQPGPFRPH